MDVGGNFGHLMKWIIVGMSMVISEFCCIMIVGMLVGILNDC